MKILLAIDGSIYTKRMLAYLAAHDELLGPERRYTVLHAVAALPPHVTGHVGHGIVEDHYQAEARKVIEPVLAFARQHDWTVDVQTPVGRAADLVAEVANAGRYDLVVMGSHGNTPLTSVVLGSVAQRVIAQSEVPVLIVP